MGRNRLKKALTLLLAFTLAFACFSGCARGNPGDDDDDGGNGGTQTETLAPGAQGWYVLQTKTVDGKDITSQFVYNCIRLTEDKAALYEVDYKGKSERDATYTVAGNTVTLQVGVKAYAYVFDAENETMRYEGKVSKQEVVMQYKYDKNFTMETAAGGASFFGELFGESKDENFYNYCPTVFMEGRDVMHVWYCSNRDSGKVIDYVGYRKGTLNKSGKWAFTDKQLVLGPTAGTWDSQHTCDPSVVKGDFAYGGKDYSYLMAYLGCTTTNNCVNEVGIAVAENPAGPWVKVEEINPIANFRTAEEYAADSWGYGQPCVIASDEPGKILLFYTKGVKSGTFVYVEEWNLANLDAPVKLREKRLSDRGVVNAAGSADVINNADFAFDPYRNRLYCIKEDFPYPTDGGVNWITGSNVLLYMELNGGTGFDKLFGESSWNVCDKLTQEKTGFIRNHNVGIITDEFGRLTNPYEVPLIYTMSEAATDYPDWPAKGQWPALHTYRLHGYTFEVK